MARFSAVARMLVAVGVLAAVVPSVAPGGVTITHADSSWSTTDGLYGGAGRLATGETRDLQVTGRGGVPATGVGAVALNVTVTDPAVSGFVTVWPTGTDRPTASNLNFVAGQTVPNMVVVKVGLSGNVSLFTNAGPLDLIVDVMGWFPEASGFTAIVPARLADSRFRGATVDGAASGSGRLGLGGIRDVTVVGRGGVPADGAAAVVVNVTAVRPSAATYLTVWPTGVPRPTASTLNATVGQTVPNLAVVKVGDGGQVSLFNLAGDTDVIVDVLGWFPTGGAYQPLTPARLADSRPGGLTDDGAISDTGTIDAGEVLTMPVAGRGGVPADGVGAVVVNIVAVDPTTSSFLTAWPAGVARPLASNLNFVGGRTVANMAIVRVGEGGQISVFNSAGETHVVVDVLGWFPADASYSGLTPARMMDTRGPAVSLPSPVVAGVPSALQLIYAVPAGVAPVAGRAEAISYTAGAVQRWFDLQTGGRHPLFVRAGQAVSVVTVQLTYTADEVLALGAPTARCINGCEMTPLVAQIRQLVPSTIDQGLVIELEGRIAYDVCGYSRRGAYQVMIPLGNCPIVPGDRGVFPWTGGSYLMAHEVTHLLGGAPSCAPHAVSAHVDDDRRDIIYTGPEPRDFEHVMLDPGHDDYYLTERSDCPDIADSPLLGTG